MGRGKLEPCQEIERFLRAEIPAVMQTARDGGEVFQTRLDVHRLILKNPATLVLGEHPPGAVLANRNERGMGRYARHSCRKRAA
jgi:hypothetical protein